MAHDLGAMVARAVDRGASVLEEGPGYVLLAGPTRIRGRAFAKKGRLSIRLLRLRQMLDSSFLSVREEHRHASEENAANAEARRRALSLGWTEDEIDSIVARTNEGEVIGTVTERFICTEKDFTGLFGYVEEDLLKRKGRKEWHRIHRRMEELTGVRILAARRPLDNVGQMARLCALLGLMSLFFLFCMPQERLITTCFLIAALLATTTWVYMLWRKWKVRALLVGDTSVRTISLDGSARE